MAGSRNREPIGRSGEVQDLNDGTTILGLTARPGTIDIGRVVELAGQISRPQHLRVSSLLGRQTSDELDYIRRLLRQFLETTDAFNLRDIVVQWFGYQCFSVGVIVGIGEAVIDTVEGLLSLVKTLVLAELHDIRTKGPDWSTLFNPVTLMREISLVPLAEVVGIFFEEELRKAAEERDALIKELLEVIQNPEQFFDSIIDDYKKDWEDLNKYMSDGTPEGKFRAGMIFGKLLFDVLSLITGAVGAAKAAAKIAAKLPRLLKLSRSFARSMLKPGVTPRGIRSGRVGGRSGTAPKQLPPGPPPPKQLPPGPPPPKQLPPGPPPPKQLPPGPPPPKTPSISPQKQAGHVKGTPQYNNRIKQGKPTSAFDDAKTAEQLTQEAWEKGTPVPGRPNVRDFDFHRSIGTGPNGGTQTKVRVHMDEKKRIHGHPTGQES
jgi:hypothetical protein